ncbi:MAG: TRAP transporter substrate-binding protein DctP, partial [Lentihominibacter sp.]
MKKVLAIVLSLTMVLAFASCGGGGSSDSGDKVVIHLGSSVATTHAWYRAAEDFKAELEEKSDGQIELVLDFGGVHGTDKEMCEAISAGTLEMGIGSTVGIDAVVTEMGFVNLPYLMTSFDEVEELMYDGWMGEKAAELMANYDLTVLDWTDCDFRW